MYLPYVQIQKTSHYIILYPIPYNSGHESSLVSGRRKLLDTYSKNKENKSICSDKKSVHFDKNPLKNDKKSFSQGSKMMKKSKAEIALKVFGINSYLNDKNSTI